MTRLLLQKEIVYHGERCVLVCDGRCDKAWGIQARPRYRFVSDDADPDDYVYLGDEHVGEAPPPGKTEIVSEGFEMKPSAVPLTDPERLNKWCARQCERSTIVKLGEPIVLPDMQNPEPNMPHRRCVVTNAIVDAARAAIVSGTSRIEVDPRGVIALAEYVRRLEARVEELRRRYEPTRAEWCEDADAQAGACWG